MEQLIFVIIGFFLGIVALLVYMIYRLMKNDEWDDSNMTNALRLLSHVVLHPNDFGKMHYLSNEQRTALSVQRVPALENKRPFWYVDKDEFDAVVKTRP